jgi:hypothetical protein
MHRLERFSKRHAATVSTIAAKAQPLLLCANSNSDPGVTRDGRLRPWRQSAMVWRRRLVCIGRGSMVYPHATDTASRSERFVGLTTDFATARRTLNARKWASALATLACVGGRLGEYGRVGRMRRGSPTGRRQRSRDHWEIGGEVALRVISLESGGEWRPGKEEAPREGGALPRSIKLPGATRHVDAKPRGGRGQRFVRRVRSS